MIFVFVEGPDDERYFASVYKSNIVNCKYIQYAGWSPTKINNFLRSINCMPDSDYLFFGDADGKSIEEKITVLKERYSNIDVNKVYVVQYEIESWYYAGISMSNCQKLKLKHFVYDTNGLTKEQFNAKLPQRIDRRIVMADILKIYEMGLAVSRNASLQLFNSSIKKESA